MLNDLTQNLVVTLVWIGCWIATIIIGAKKGTGCASAIVGVLGPIGLLAAILDKGRRVKCRYCQEYIDRKAIKCPKCQSDLRQQSIKPRVEYQVPPSIVQKAPSVIQSNDNDDLAAEQLRAINRLNLDKYTELPFGTLQSIITAVKIEVMDGTPWKKTLAPTIAENPELKELIYSYANTLKGDYIQMMEDITAESYTNRLYWVYEGPDDNQTRAACKDLLAIQYFTNWQRKEAERLTYEDRKFDCRHTFMLISGSNYHDGIKNRKVDYGSVHNPSMVKALLED